ncbi:MAG: hypothetical protein K0R14_1878 [Burkholderiales bacterium]|jgi:hypothetical protein|nr:hypothetical protein [Burkholderiales bacterium]
MKKLILNYSHLKIFALIISSYLGISNQAYGNVKVPFTVINRFQEPLFVEVTVGSSNVPSIKQIIMTGNGNNFATGGTVTGSDDLLNTNNWNIRIAPLGWDKYIFGVQKECKVKTNDLNPPDNIRIFIDGGKYEINMLSGSCKGDFKSIWTEIPK